MANPDNAIRQRVKRGHGCKVNEKNGHEKRQDVFGGPRDIKAVTVASLAIKSNYNMETTPTQKFSLQVLLFFLFCFLEFAKILTT